MRDMVWRWIFAICIIAILVLALQSDPPRLPADPSDKIQHMLAFGALAFIAPLAFRQMSLLAIGLGLSAMGGLIELLQMVPAVRRDSDLSDWLVDIGAVVAVLLLRRLARRHSGTSAPVSGRDES
jgi:VanZ family protein